MDWGIWYDLAVLELSELNDPSNGKLVEAEKAHVPAAADQEPVEVSEQPV